MSQLVMFWNEKAAELLDMHTNPADDTRRFAVIQIAIHDALNSIRPLNDRLFYQGEIKRNSSPDAAITAAAYKAMEWVIQDIDTFSKSDTFKPEIWNGKIFEWYTDSMAAIPDGIRKVEGMMVGAKAAAAIIENRADDKRNQVIKASDRANGTQPTEFRADYYTAPPAPNNKLLINYGIVKPFVINTGEGYLFRQDPQYKDLFDRSKDLEEVKVKGSENTVRSLKEIETVDFWSDLKQHVIWNNYARAIAKTRNLNEWELARLFALMNTAMADGAIAMFKDIYHFYHWRPVTAINYYIQNANPVTEPKWNPYKFPPRVPEYPSAFGILGGAAGEILKSFFGDFTGQVYLKKDRLSSFSYDTISNAVYDNSITKINCGWNFRKTAKDSIVQGQQIGWFVLDNKFKKRIGGIPWFRPWKFIFPKLYYRKFSAKFSSSKRAN